MCIIDVSYPLKRIANQFLEVFLNHQSCALRRGEFETVKIAYSCVIFVIKNEIFLIFQAKNLQKPYKVVGV